MEPGPKLGKPKSPGLVAINSLLILVEEVRPAELDLKTAAAIRQELSKAWLREQLRGVTTTFPLLDAL